MSYMFYFGVLLLCPPCRASLRDSHYRVLQYVHDSLMARGESDISLYLSKGVVGMRVKRT